MRNAFGKWFASHSLNNRESIILSGDIGYGIFDDLRMKNDSAFLNCGIAEQNMIGVAAGLASKNLQPWVYTIIPFLIFRPFEFVRNMICHQNLNVKLVGVGGGLVYDTLGFTHYALEDLALTRHLPNLQILLPYDPISAIRCFEYASKNSKPTYIRLMKGGEQTVESLKNDDGFDILSNYGEDLTLVGHGSVVAELVKASVLLLEKGFKCKVLALWNAEKIFSLAELLGNRNFFFEEHFKHGIFDVFSLRPGCFTNYIEYNTLKKFEKRDELLRLNNMTADLIVSKILARLN